MENTELINRLRDVPCWAIGTETEETMHAAANALESDEQRIDGLQKLVDINTERCEALRQQLREAHESYEKHLNELEAQLPKEGEWIWENYYWHCSVCGKNPTCGMGYVQGKNELFKVCPNCGAKMKKGEEK